MPNSNIKLKCVVSQKLRTHHALESFVVSQMQVSLLYKLIDGFSIIAPYNIDNPTLESNIMSFWVVPPPENRIMEYGRPMLMSYSVNQDTELSEEVISEMNSCIDYYKRFPMDMVDFLADYTEDTTYIEKLKVTLYSKFPRKQDDHQFWNWLRDRLGLEKESEFTPPKWPASRNSKEEEQLQMLQKSEIAAAAAGTGSAGTLVLSENGSHLDLSKQDGKISKDDKLLIRSLQEQLSLPSGLNMNPSPISSTLLPLPNVANSMSSNNSVQTSSSSPRDSPITIPSNSASPAKFEVPIRASPSPAKSDTSSTKTRNSPAPSPNKYANSSGGDRNDRMDRYDRSDRVSISSVGHNDILTRSSPNLSTSSSQHKYDFSGTTISAVPSSALMQQQQQQQLQHQQQAAAAQQQAAAAQQQISDYYSAANYASLAKNLSGFSPSDYAMLFQSKDYGLSSLNQLASAAGMTGLGGVTASSSSSVGNNRNDGGNNSGGGGNNKQSSSSTTNTSTSQSVAAAATAAAMAGNMKDFLAQLEKSTELSYLMQSQYSYPQMSSNSKSTNDYSGGGGGKSKHEKKGGRGQSAQQQQQRQLEEEYKKDANKINEFMRSQEYANLLMEQAEALNASGYSMATEPPPPKKSSKKSSSSQHHNNASSSAAAAAAAAASVADLTSLLQASPKIHELNSLFQSGKPSDLHALLQQQFAGLPATSTSSPSSSSSSSHQSKKQSQQQQQQQQHLQQQQQQLQDYSALFAHSKMSDLQSLMASGLGGQSHGLHQSNPSAAELSALFTSALSGKSADASALSASVDMLGSLLQAGGAGKSSDLSSLLFSQANAAELNQLFAQTSTASSSKQSSAAAAANSAAAAYYTQAAIDKAQLDMAALYQQHNKYAAIPDPLSKSTLAANNMFMNPSTIYANMKMQQEAINAMIMKPPKVSSSSSTTSSSKSREASASPALEKSLKNSNRDSPASLNSMKYNFSAADLAISSVPASGMPLLGTGSIADLSRKMSDTSPSALLDMSLVDASQLESRLKKRMEFSSIADLVAAPPPSKMQKLEELASMHQSSTQHQDDSDALNLSND